MKAATKRNLWKRFRQSWGYLLLAITYLVFFASNPSPRGYLALAVCALVVLIFLLFQAKMPCGVENRRDGFCRNDGRGFVRGCKHFQSHKWLKLAALFKKDVVTRPWHGMLSRMDGKAAAVASGASVVMMVMATLTFFVGGTTR